MMTKYKCTSCRDQGLITVDDECIPCVFCDLGARIEKKYQMEVMEIRRSRRESQRLRMAAGERRPTG